MIRAAMAIGCLLKEMCRPQAVSETERKFLICEGPPITRQRARCIRLPEHCSQLPSSPVLAAYALRSLRKIASCGATRSCNRSINRAEQFKMAAAATLVKVVLTAKDSSDR